MNEQTSESQAEPALESSNLDYSFVSYPNWWILIIVQSQAWFLAIKKVYWII